MSWIDYFFKSWTRFSDFKSESDRKEFWIFALFNLGIFFLLFLFISYSVLSNQEVLDIVNNSIKTVLSYFHVTNASEFPLNADSGIFPWVLLIAFFSSVLCWAFFISSPIFFYLFVLIVTAPVMCLSGVYSIQVALIYMLAVMIPYLALSIRRLRNAGYGLIAFFSQLIPVAGPFIYVFFLAKYGADKKETLVKES